MTVRYGIDVLRARGYDALSGKRIGLLTTFAAIDSDLRRTYDLLRSDNRVRLTALFAPEHGLAGVGREGEKIPSSVDARTGLPVHSLYGATMRPTPEMLTDVDAVVFDVPDVGARYFTFLWTLTYIMAVTRDVEIIVLDRPNPLGGAVVDGGALDPALVSIVGGDNVPVRHGMTVGEMARMIYAGWDESLSGLTVIPCENWRRDTLWNETGLIWSPPSPNMPRFETALHYPGACLIEGTTLSEGRGTPQPFEIVGAPFIDETQLADALNALDLAGVRFRPYVFKPTVSKWAGEVCQGVHAHITDPRTYRSIETWTQIILTIRRLYPDHFEWLPAFNGVYHFDRLWGNTTARSIIERDSPWADLTADWDEYQTIFKEFRKPYLLYD